MTSAERLSDLGEFRILSEVLLPAAREREIGDGVGDDCGFIELGDTLLAISADAGPRPLVWELPGQSDDYAAFGWHAAVATISDLATAGASPAFLVDTIAAPGDLPVGAFRELAGGFFDACREFNFQCLGGDLREAPGLRFNVFGVGIVEHGVRIGRDGMRVGDRVVVIGPSGAFATDYLAARRRGPLPPGVRESSRLRFPVPQLAPMRALTAAGLVAASSDSSDGVLGAVANLAAASSVGVALQLGDHLLADALREQARLADCDPWNLYFFWGDWSVVVAVPEESWPEFRATAAGLEVPWAEVGRAVEGSGIMATLDGVEYDVDVVRNESFAGIGFNAGVGAHVEYMLHTEILRRR